MHDPRMETLAKNLINYSCRLKKGETILIETYDIPHQMVVQLIRAARKAGTCVDVIMRLYDRLDKSAEDLFFRSEQWYQPPGIP